jgi:hypothetical protein
MASRSCFGTYTFPFFSPCSCIVNGATTYGISLCFGWVFCYCCLCIFDALRDARSETPGSSAAATSNLWTTHMLPCHRFATQYSLCGLLRISLHWHAVIVGVDTRVTGQRHAAVCSTVVLRLLLCITKNGPSASESEGILAARDEAKTRLESRIFGALDGV